VEEWSAHGEPSATAQLAQARSFIKLGLFDRAWARLQTLDGGKDPEIAILTGRMFIARGWNNKARKAVEKALKRFPRNRILSELFDQASEPPTEPDITDAEPGDGPAAIAAARHYMATGSLVKARAILEQQRKARPNHELISSLLWALDGDFSLDGTLQGISRRYGSSLQTLLPDMPDDPEHTETVSANDLLPSEDSGAFPALFRNMEPRTEFYGGLAGGDDEVTHISAMAGLEEMKTAPPETRDTDPGDLMPSNEVTEIQMVVRKDGAMEKDTGSGENNSIYDLATLPPFHVSDLDLGPEQEDADVIVHTRREDTIDPDDADAVTQIGAVRLETETEPEIRTRQLNDEAATWAAPPKKEEPKAVDKSSKPGGPPRKRKKARAPSRWPWHVAALLGVLAFSAFIIFAAIALPFVVSLF